MMVSHSLTDVFNIFKNSKHETKATTPAVPWDNTEGHRFEEGWKGESACFQKRNAQVSLQQALLTNMSLNALEGRVVKEMEVYQLK